MPSQTRQPVFNERALAHRPSRPSYYAEVPIGSLDEQSQLVEQVLQFVFDTLGVRHLDVRVFGADQESQGSQLHSRLFTTEKLLVISEHAL